jgi:hypothetical protein
MEKHRVYKSTDDTSFFSQMMVDYATNATIGLDDLIRRTINDITVIFKQVH